MKNIQGQVVLVTGATRGLGKGIALALGEAGATVYITGRSFEQSLSEQGISGSLQETQAAVTAVGGICIPVQVDHSDDDQVRLLFERVQDEQQGKLDLLVNNVYSGVQALRDVNGQPFWNFEPSLWDACNHVGLRSHYVASIFAARIMIKRQQGLICTISSWGGLSYIFGTAYGAGKAGCDRLAADMATELKPHNVTSISLWPGIVGTEHISQMVSAMEVEDTTDPRIAFMKEHYNWETPLLTGRVIAKLASETNIIHRTGKVHIVAELAQKYGVVDRDGNLPVSLRSLNFILPLAIPALQKYPWLIPNLKIPWSLLLLKALSSPQI
ncbi:MAG: SDR family NAD(P)-dependent oxidoreductase [Richelia sp.]|nr:SDR family NAD(P)-dependent oxidoreductase [Richelia sp.]